MRRLKDPVPTQTEWFMDNRLTQTEQINSYIK